MKYNAIFATSILSILLLAGCAKPENSTQATTATAAIKTLNVGSDLTFPPYEYLQDGVPSGFSVEMMEKIAQVEGGYSTQWVDTRWANLIPGLKSQKFDILFSSMYITKERLEQIDMIPYYKTDIALLVRQDSQVLPQGPNDLCGQVVGAMKGTAFASQVQEISKERCVAQGKAAITLREFETSPQTTQALLARAVNIQYDDAAVMMAAVKSLPEKVKISSTEQFFPIVGGIGVRKGDTATYQMIESGLNKLKASGDFEKLLNTYGLQAPTEADIAAVMNK
ncbi:transporter substrate-binding domain-containing protein [uncultured Acinetobacter sp.]|uniref:transporter substrate-binding domain-containing protein n=1 Tax=uncultured Acinetobacter sp. TaxID=165433 RepID=UPI0026228AE8|nr:transporter substrate-binding domain-containing protein [uncultured Acinetobacter sp.]